jgi:uncharacterized MAPEG superfamily protein
MTAAEWCVFGTLMLYLLTIAPIKWIGFRRFDNSKPRDPAFYVLTYLGDRPMLRSILWSIGFAINLAIFFMPAIRSHLPI